MADASGTSFSEERRLAALHALALLDGVPSADFDALVALAADMLDCPVAMLNLIDRDRQWVMAGHAAPFAQTRRDVAFCDHTVRNDTLTVVEDARRDARFAGNPLIDAHGMAFYAGLPIHAADADGTRHAIGALCVMDAAPRMLDAVAERKLRHLATLAEALIAARASAQDAIRLAAESGTQAARLARQERVMRQAERMAMIGSWRVVLATDEVEWSENVYRIHGLPIGQRPTLDRALDFYPPRDRAIVADALALLIDKREPVDIEVDFIAATGERRRVRSVAELEVLDGKPHAIVGIFQDITERHALEQALRRSADIDELTGIANRAAFNRRLAATIAASQAADTPLLLALVDLDGFKAINDTLGHLAGDDVLRAVGRRLEQPWLRGSFAARLGGDEFALIVDDPALTADPAGFADRLEAELCVPVTAGGLTIATAGTVGTAMLADGPETVRDLVHRTDTALYASKRRRIGERKRVDRRMAG